MSIDARLPLVSIILPTFNVAVEIARTIETLQQQTLSSLEILVIDDASTDGTADVVAAATAGDPRVQLTRLKENRGVQHARFVGIGQARGAWVGFVDGDDWVEPQMFARLSEVAQAHQADVAVCDAWHDRLAQQPQRLLRLPGPCIVETPAALLEFLVDRRSAVALWNKLFRRERLLPVLERQREQPWPRIDLMEDKLLCAAVFAESQRLTYIAEPLYHYVERPGSAMASFDAARVRTRMANYALVLGVLQEERAAYHPVLAVFVQKTAEIVFDAVTRDIARLETSAEIRADLRRERDERFGRHRWLALRVWLDRLL